MALTRARVVSATAFFGARVEEEIRAILCTERDPGIVARDVMEMRAAVAEEKGEDERWDLKYAAGGVVDLEFIAQFLQLVHASSTPEILNTHTGRVLENAQSLKLLAKEDADTLRAAFTLYHDLTQVLRLCLTSKFDPKTAGPRLLSLLARAGELPDFTTLEAHLFETQVKVRKLFQKIVGGAAAA
jgi:glutamate-ammonia-ligase adenylyltransferase